MEAKLKKSVKALSEVVGVLLGKDVLVATPKTVREIAQVRYM